jgi:hypothetical protein
MGNRGREKVLRQYDWEVIGGRLEATFERLVNGER